MEVISKIAKLLIQILSLLVSRKARKGSDAKKVRENAPEVIEDPDTTPQSALEVVAEDLNVDPKLIQAFIEVESGKYHMYEGRLVINYEAHYFKNRSGQVVPDRNIIKGDRLNQEDEYRNFKEALAINEKAAYESISMGKSQIMGANYKILGYASAREMFEAFSLSEDNAILGFGAFVKATKSLHRACQEFDFHKMAYYYNGPAYRKYVDRKGRTYADRIKERFGQLKDED